MAEPFNLRLLGATLLVLLTVSACQRDRRGPNDNPPQIEDEHLMQLPASVDDPANNPTTAAKVTLGRALFWDPILSGGKDIACATCHHPDFGYADGRDLSSGVGGNGLGPSRQGGEIIRRNAPTVLNAAFNGIDINGNQNPGMSPMFWDNRAQNLEEQALLPILSAEEMCGDDIAETDILDTVIARLVAINEYQELFNSAFGNTVIDEERIAMALASFQRTLVTGNSRFDQYMRGDEDALSNQELEGLNTFLDAGCADCHNGPMLSDFELHTLSVPNDDRVMDNGATGRFDFRTPTLRNLDFTAPYMHNGHFNTLRDVLEFYDDISGGGQNSQNPNVNDNQIAEDARDLDLNNNDINEILAFLNTLNDDNFDRTIPQSVPSGLPVGGEID